MQNQANIIIFQNRTITLNNNLLGHSGWGFKLPDGKWLFGSKEATPDMFKFDPLKGHLLINIPNGSPNGVFFKKADFGTMINLLKKGRNSTGPKYNYHEYKLLHHPNPDYDSAFSVAKKSKGEGYSLISNNCMDSAYRIITAYARGDGNFLPWPSTHPLPNHFFDDIKSKKMKF